MALRNVANGHRCGCYFLKPCERWDYKAFSGFTVKNAAPLIALPLIKKPSKCLARCDDQRHKQCKNIPKFAKEGIENCVCKECCLMTTHRNRWKNRKSNNWPFPAQISSILVLILDQKCKKSARHYIDNKTLCPLIVSLFSWGQNRCAYYEKRAYYVCAFCERALYTRLRALIYAVALAFLGKIDFTNINNNLLFEAKTFYGAFK